MKKVLLTFLFSGCLLARDVPPIEAPKPEIEKIENACFPSAIILTETLKEYKIWSRMIQVLYKIPSEKNNQIRGHAFIEYVYPKDSTNLWLYDNTGSWKVDYSLKDNPSELAKKIFEDNGSDFELVRAKYFFED